MMRAIVVVALVAAFVQVAHARPPPLTTWEPICVIALGYTDEDRIELVHFAGTNVDGGVYRTNAVGFAARYQITDTLLAIAEARALFAGQREPVPVAFASDRRQSVTSVELGVIPIHGKLLLSDDWLARFEVITSLGIGFVERGNVVWQALSYGVAMRVPVNDWLSVDLGIHDDYVGGWAYASRAVAERAAPPAHDLTPPAHDVEARLGIGVWFPSRRHHKCRTTCS